MVQRLPAWFFFAISIGLLGIVQITFFRSLLGVVSRYEMPFSTVVIILIAALMSGLTAMLLHARRANTMESSSTSSERDASVCRCLHLSGFMLYTGLPLANYFTAYLLWRKYRHLSKTIHRCAIEVLNFQIAVYLYLLLALFLVVIVFGLLAIPCIFLFHFLSTLFAVFSVGKNPQFTYLGNIPIIQGRIAVAKS